MAPRRVSWIGLEHLESRRLLASIAVDAGQILRAIDERMLGTNITWWQWELDTAQMRQMVIDSGMKLFRLPGGTSSNDNRHFDTTNPYGGYKTPPILANFIESVGGDGMVSVNYGTGSPQEAAAYLAYYNASVGDTTVIGFGQQWDPGTNTWVQKDWRTAGYWASLRAAAPLAVDDGLNLLRANHPAPWGFTYWGIGNENYAIWENDKHGQGGDSGAPQDAATYIAFAKTFSDLALQIDPGIEVGLEVILPLQWNEPDLLWVDHLLDQSVQQGFVPGFFSDHAYITGLSDQNLLLHSINDPSFTGYLGNPASWAGRANYYRTRINQHLGNTVGAGVELMLTEFNSDLGNKQSVSLVNGLWVADAIAGLAQTEYTVALQWDLTNGYNPLPPDSSHYGWREGNDNGLISTGSANGPTSGPYVPYPTYFSEQLLSKVIGNGGSVVSAVSDDPYLSTYAFRQADGGLGLLVINKSPTSNLTGAFALSGFEPAAQAQFWQYGKAEDTAQSLTSDGHSSLSSFSSALTLSEGGFSYVFPAYSMTVIELVSRIDETAPTATTAPGAVTPGAATYTFTVRYSDNVAIRRSTLDDNDIVVEGPNGFRQLARFLGASVAGDGSPITATYSILAPGGAWDDADNGSYEIAVRAGQVTDAGGNAVAAGRIGVFNAGMDTTPPAATLSASRLTAIDATYRFTVTYVDGTGVLRSTLSGQDVRVVGPQGSSFEATAQLLSISGGSGNAQTLTATYAITGPDGQWDAADNGTYSVRLVANQIADTVGNQAPGQVLGAFQVAILTIDNPGPLQIDGTPNADTISITQGDGGILSVLLNGISQDYTGVTSLTVFGLEGNDTITLGSSVLIPATLVGGAGNDSIVGGKAADLLRGGGGKDTLRGGGAADTLNGNGGADLLVGNGGRDRLWGGGGNDTLKGSGASDTLIGGNGSDLLQGGGGDDWFLARDSFADTLTGGPGTDRAQTDPILDLLSDVESLLA